MTGFEAATRVDNIRFCIGVPTRVTCKVRCEMCLLKKVGKYFRLESVASI